MKENYYTLINIIKGHYVVTSHEGIEPLAIIRDGYVQLLRIEAKKLYERDFYADHRFTYVADHPQVQQSFTESC